MMQISHELGQELIMALLAAAVPIAVVITLLFERSRINLGRKKKEAVEIKSVHFPENANGRKFEYLRELNGEFLPTGEFFREVELHPHSAVLARSQQEGVAFAARLAEDQGGE